MKAAAQDALRQQMTESERGLLLRLEEFTRLRKHAPYALVAEMFQNAREIKARDRRSTFKVV